MAARACAGLLALVACCAHAAPAPRTRRAVVQYGGALGASSVLHGVPVLPAAAAVGAPVCDQAVDMLRDASGRRVWMCGTAHISRDSAELVRSLIREVRPDVVMVELDRPRLESLLAKDAQKQQAAAAASSATAAAADGGGGGPSKEQGVVQGFAQDLMRPGSLPDRLKRAQSNAIGRSLSNMYSSLEGLGFEAGDEFRTAVAEALDTGAQVVLGDQDVRTTLDALRDALGQTDLKALLTAPAPELPQGAPADAARALAPAGALGAGADSLDAAAVSAAVQALKERENTRAVVASFKEAAPALHRALIADRDQYMANSIDKAGGQRLVAVVGLAHLDGIEAELSRRGMQLQPKRGCPSAG